jgi:hypothetical protein
VAGYYSAASASTCAACSAGTFSAYGSSTTCTTVPANYYANAPSAATDKVACPVSYSSPAGSDALADCYFSGRRLASAVDTAPLNSSFIAIGAVMTAILLFILVVGALGSSSKAAEEVMSKATTHFDPYAEGSTPGGRNVHTTKVDRE